MNALTFLTIECDLLNTKGFYEDNFELDPLDEKFNFLNNKIGAHFYF